MNANIQSSEMQRYANPATSMQIILAVIPIAFSFVFSGCSTGNVSQNSIPGKYKVTYEPYVGMILATETIDIKPNGTYDQVFLPTHGKILKNSGTWSIEQNTYQGTMVVLKDLLHGVDESGSKLSASPEHIDSYLPVVRKGSNIKIIIDDDMGYYYIKTK